MNSDDLKILLSSNCTKRTSEKKKKLNHKEFQEKPQYNGYLFPNLVLYIFDRH